MDKYNRTTGFEKLAIMVLLLVAIAILLTAIALVFDDDCCCCCGQAGYRGDAVTVVPTAPEKEPSVSFEPSTPGAPSVGSAPTADRSTEPQISSPLEGPTLSPPPKVVSHEGIYVPPARHVPRGRSGWEPEAVRVVEVPEPRSLGLLGLGLAALVAGRVWA